jgi:hypothetical protein
VENKEVVQTCDLTAHAGHCPACHLEVSYKTEGSDGPVWTCPYNLPEGNPHRVDPPWWITEELMTRNGVYSYCPDDHGKVCAQEPLPLHGACYDRKW